MKPRLDLLTLGVRDLDATRRFYVQGLGWPVIADFPGEVIFVQIGHGLLLSLWDLDHMIEEAGPVGTSPASITLGHIVPTEAEVTEVLERAVAAGGALLTEATRREWGGLSGYFGDPDGYRWEVAYNPGFQVAADGTVSLATVTE
jgi:catechol 2,3-dioxygenase-like lactoylglutathione lyase family enzyme